MYIERDMYIYIYRERERDYVVVGGRPKNVHQERLTP